MSSQVLTLSSSSLTKNARLISSILLVMLATSLMFPSTLVVVDAWSVLPIAPITPVVPPAATTSVVVESQAADIMIQAAYLLTRTTKTTSLSDNIYNWTKQGGEVLSENLGVPPANAAEIEADGEVDTAVTAVATGPPTKDEIITLQKAFGAFYGPNRDPVIALPLLDESIKSFERQPADERAGLYRVRGDCKMSLKLSQDAINDYTIAIDLLKIDAESMNKADPIELPASYLGRARAIRSLGPKQIINSKQAAMGVDDYKQTLILNSREDWDTIQEQIEDGCKTNPYAAWEYGMALRQNSQYEEAKVIHILTSDLFDSISDRSRSVISLLDAGIDTACQEIVSGKISDNDNDDSAKSILKKAVQYTTTAESRDVGLLQRVVAKEGEGRIVLAALEWSDKSLRNDAERELSTACERLDQLEQDALQRVNDNNKKTNNASTTSTSLRFNIDDYPGALETSCSRLKNTDFQTERLEWPTVLQDKTQKLFQLK